MRIGAYKTPPAQPTLPASRPLPKKAAEDQDWFEAGSLMTQRGIELQNHRLMQENVATYLAHRPEGEAIPTGRWESKLNRDLSQPYTDREVLQHIDGLQTSLVRNLEELPSNPKEVYVTGSFSKGRLGVHSDLNGYVKLPSDEFQTAFQTFQKRHNDAPSNKANLFPLSESSPGFNKAMLMVEGSSVKISTERLEEKGYLRSVYSDLLQTKSADRVESKPASDGLVGKMWRSKFERETFHFRAMRWALHLGGTLSRVPLLGCALQSGVEKIVRQDHRDLT